MKVSKKILFVALLLSLILSAGAVTAQDNLTFEQSDIQTAYNVIDDQNEIKLDNDAFKSSDAASKLGEGSSLNVNGDNFTSIQDTINSAGEGDTIYLDGKTYYGYGSQINVNKKNLTIIGGSKDNSNLTATLDAQSSSRIMQISATNVTICGIKFINANSDRGAAVRWEANDGFLTNCNFEDNSATLEGGALRWAAKRGIVTYCTFEKNYSPNGGAIYWIGANGFLSDCSFENNNASEGGAVCWNDHYGYLANSRFVDNFADNGGAISWQNGKNSYILNSTFINNSAKNGGAIQSNSFGTKSILIKNNDFIDNTAQLGGAIHILKNELTIDSNTFKGNDAEYEGSVILVEKSNNTITNNIIDNGNSGKHAIFISNSDNLIIESNTFTNPQLDIGYYDNTVIYIDFDSEIISFIDKTIDFPFHVHDAMGIPFSGEVSFDWTSAGEKWTVVETLGTYTLTDGKTTLTKQVANYPGTWELEAYFRLDNGVNEKRVVNVIVVDTPIYSIGQSDSVTDDLEIKFVRDATGIIMFDVCGNNYFAEISDASAKIRIDNLANGKYAVNMIYSGDSNYQRQEKIVVLNITHAKTTVIDVNDSFEGFAGDNIRIPVYVHDSLGNPLDGFVTLSGYGAEKLVGGKAVFDIVLPNVASVLTLAVMYEDDFEMIQVNVIPHVKSIVIDVNDSFEGFVGDNIRIPVYVHDSLGNPLDGFVTLSGYGAEKLVGGKAVFDIVLPNVASVLTLAVMYEDHFKMILVKANPTKTDPEPVNPVYKITGNNDITVGYSNNVVYRVLITKDGKAVGAGENVVFNFNGKNINVKTDSQGYASLNLDTSLKIGTYAVKTTYNGVSVENKVKITHLIKTSDKKVKKSAKVTKIKISLNRVNGKYLNAKTLKIKFNGKTYKVKTNRNGVAIWKVKKSMIKKLKVGKKVKYSVTYGKDVLTKKLTIKK